MKSPFPYPIAILFDWDNTLADTTRICFVAFCKVMEHFGKEPFSYEEFTSIPPYSVRGLFQHVLPGNDQAEALFYQFLPPHHATPIDGAQDLLDCLHGQSIPLALVSNKKGDALRKEVGAFGWDHYFFGVVGSHDTPEDKPSAVPLEHAVLQKEGLICGPNIWFVGDSRIDQECAQNAGCTPVLINKQCPRNAFPLFQSCGDFLRFIQDHLA